MLKLTETFKFYHEKPEATKSVDLVNQFIHLVRLKYFKCRIFRMEHETNNSYYGTDEVEHLFKVCAGNVLYLNAKGSASRKFAK